MQQLAFSFRPRYTCGQHNVNQIITKDYAVRFTADTRPVWAVGLNISEDHRTIDQWKVVRMK